MDADGYLVGAFPHSEDLAKANMDYARGRITKKQLARTIEKDRTYLIDLQRRAGFKFITDGMLTWGDLFGPFTRFLGGVEAGPLKRWFNNNTFYWTPKVTRKVKRTTRILAPFIQTSGHVNKLIVPGPYTFSRLAENRYYRDVNELMFDFAQALNTELRSLSSRFRYLQFNEPCLAFRGSKNRDEAESIREAVRLASKNLKCETCLHTYFGSVEGVYPWILDLPVDTIGIDFCETRLEDLAAVKFRKGLACGIVNARSSFIEDPLQIANFAKRAADRLSPRKVFICTSADLEYRPANIARKKISAIAKAIQFLRE